MASMASDRERTAAEKVIESHTSRSMCRAWRMQLARLRRPADCRVTAACAEAELFG
jgi:hypothetical protein